MNIRAVIAPTEIAPEWLSAIDESARVLLGPHDRVGDALSLEVSRLSELYTRDRGALRTQSAQLAARLRFFLPRDLPKIEGPLAELWRIGGLPRERPWRVLDLGAGLGATTLGAATFARRCGIESIHSTVVEHDARALDVLAHIAGRAGQGALAKVSARVELERIERDLEPLGATSRDVRTLASKTLGGPFDLVLMGLALNELYVDRDDRLERRLALLTSVAERLAPGGSIVVIEPALKETTRELMRLRDLVAALTDERRVLTIAAPCTRTGPCPMLRGERDWCHEDLPLSLPEPLRSIARGAGLRWEGLSYAALVLRRDGLSVASPASDPKRALRIVGGPIESKGRTELHGCGEDGLVRLVRLARHQGASPLDGAARGSVLECDRAVPDGAVLRTDRDVTLTRLDRD